MPSPLDGRTALVTGAGRSVGRGIAERLAEAGAFVLVNEIHADRADETVGAIQDGGGRAAATVFDVTDSDAVRAAFEILDTEGHEVDVLVNNAGIAEGSSSGVFAESDPADWRATIDLNLFGSMNMIRAVLPGMVERRWGRIIQISSGAASQGLRIGVSTYGAGKAAVESLVRHVAVENGRNGVTANTIALGLMANVADNLDGDSGVARLVSSIPVGRLGEPREVGALAAFLASDDAAYITGQVIHLNGGNFFGR